MENIVDVSPLNEVVDRFKLACITAVYKHAVLRVAMRINKDTLTETDIKYKDICAIHKKISQLLMIKKPLTPFLFFMDQMLPQQGLSGQVNLQYLQYQLTRKGFWFKISLMKQALTSRQQDIYSYIRQSLEEQKESPTLEELRRFINVGSLNTVVQHLVALEHKGYILRRKHAKRNIELREMHRDQFLTTSVPVVASVGCDDLSVCANEQYDESIEVDKNLITEKGSVVAVRAIGNSMNEADIHNGDYVLISLTDHVENGDRVAVIVGDIVTIKRFERKNGITILRPESTDPKYKPIILRDDFKIQGKVICSIPASSMDITEIVPIPQYN